MKVLHCIAQLPMKTGSGVYCTMLVEGMAQRGWDTAVLYGTQPPFSAQTFRQSVDAALSSRIQEFPVTFLSDALPFPIAGMSDVMPYQSTVYSAMTDAMLSAWMTAFKHRLQQAVSAFQPDVIIAHHLFILTSLITELFPRVPVIAVSHGTDIRQLKQHPQIHERYIKNLSGLNTVFTVTPKDTDEISRLLGIAPNKIRLAGGGFNPRLFNDAQRHHFDGTFRLVYAGKIAESKGIFELAKALPLILARYPYTELTLIGNASEEQHAQLLQNAQGSPHLHIHNALTQKDMSDMLKQMDIFILPSYYEALGLVAVEALACGLRVVATEIEGLKTLLGDAVNNSGIIEYTALPRIYNVDQAVEEDKPIFVSNLAQTIMLQMERISMGHDIYPAVAAEIHKHSWNDIVEKICEAVESAHLRSVK